MADGISLLTELAPEVLTTKNGGLRYNPGSAKKKNSRLSLKHLNLALQSPAIVLSRTFEVIVHLLDVGHEIRKVRSFHG